MATKIVGGNRRKISTTDADIHFDISDEKIREAFRQLYDNTRALNESFNSLSNRMEDNEQAIIDIENRV